MKISKHQQLLQSRSSRKGAIIDIDSIIAYVIFIAIIVFLVNYSLSLTTPFITRMDTLNKEKSTITLSKMVNNNFAINQLSQACNITYPGLARLSLIYEIKAFNMPYTGNSSINPLDFNGSIIFNREGETLRVIIASQNEQKNINALIMLSNPASVNNISLDSGDSFTTYYDELSNFVVAINSKVQNGDIDELTIKPVNDIVYFEINGIDLTSTYIEDLPASDQCGFTGLKGPRTSFERYGIISDGRNDYYIKIIGDAGWTG